MDDYNVNYDIKIDSVKSTKDVNQDANNNGFGWHIISDPMKTGELSKPYAPTNPTPAIAVTSFLANPIVKRGDERVKIRIDYSTDPGYWAEIVAAQPGIYKRRIKSRSDFEVVKREMQEEVDRNHEGSWPDFLDHKFSLDRRSTPEHELHELHARWFSYDLARWMDRFSKVDETFEVASYSVNDRVRWNLFSWTQICELMGIPTEMYMKVWADLDINVETTAELNLIVLALVWTSANLDYLRTHQQGDFGDMSSWRESHMLFRSKGEIKTTLNLWAFARMAFNSDEVELFGLDKFGATFSIPGLVTVGPNLRVKAQLDGEATLHTEAAVSLKIAEWEYTQQYPNTMGVTQNPPKKHSGATSFFDKAAPNDSGFPQPTFHADVDAHGYLTVTMKPVVSFGLTWAIDVPDVSAELGIEAYATIHADAQANVNNVLDFACGGADDHPADMLGMGTMGWRAKVRGVSGY
ncbi:hypothetical protein B0H65DRAFT_446351 [Neurospora tetraspora]|uniref:Uncharacterized protein n=1 Tax=Neurospora tetraspora TaxID=94610 RepID=A0AAE0MMY0_9PEZI|nr:hypothetical protein B0H65DRAFT_446351 [Neurospora tetraspora]